MLTHISLCRTSITITDTCKTCKYINLFFSVLMLETILSCINYFYPKTILSNVSSRPKEGLKPASPPPLSLLDPPLGTVL